MSTRDEQAREELADAAARQTRSMIADRVYFAAPAVSNDDAWRIADRILDNFDRLAGPLGYVKADREEWGVQSPFGNIRPCGNEGIARLLTTNWSAVRRLVGPWEVA